MFVWNRDKGELRYNMYVCNQQRISSPKDIDIDVRAMNIQLGRAAIVPFSLWRLR